METDSFTKSGATRLAAQILQYWVMVGLSGVKVWVEPLQSFNPELGMLWQVRSNVGECIVRDSVLQRFGVSTA